MKDAVTEVEVKTAMDVILAKNLFKSTSGDLISKDSAESDDSKIVQSKGIDDQRADKNEPSSGAEIAVDEVDNNQAIPEVTTETTTKDNKKDSKALVDFKAVVDFYSENIRLPGSYELEKIKYLCDEFKDLELIIFALEQSVGGRSFTTVN